MEGQKVYGVFDDYIIGEGDLISLFSSKQKAEEFVKERESLGDLTITELEIN